MRCCSAGSLSSIERKACGIWNPPDSPMIADMRKSSSRSGSSRSRCNVSRGIRLYEPIMLTIAPPGRHCGSGTSSHSLTERPNDLDRPHDVVVQFVQIAGRNPPFRVLRRADLMDLVAAHELAAHLEPRDETAPAVAHVPSRRDLGRVCFGCHGIEDRLFGEPRRPACEVARLQQREFVGSDRPIERNGADLLMHRRRQLSQESPGLKTQPTALIGSANCRRNYRV